MILISVGYGRDASGYPSNHFGPLNAEGGGRRLNVLISRAKLQCIVFSSMRSGDIDLKNTSSAGVRAFKAFLHYAETGITSVAQPTVREMDSEFEVQVAAVLRSHGYEVDAQVGLAGFFIDLAVIDSSKPGRYLLGIECDGATYHSARWARDRDRLRQEVLEDHGWTIYRIWSTDWFQSQEEQTAGLLQKIADLQSSNSARDTGDLAFPLPVSGSEKDPREIERDPVSKADDEAATHSVPYQEAAFQHLYFGLAIHELRPQQLSEIAVKIAELEGPIHADEVARRMIALWRGQRVGIRITAAVAEALRWSVTQGLLAQEGAFYSLPGQREFPIRDREAVKSSTLRKPEMIPPQEVDSGILTFLRSHISAKPEEVARGLARWMGFRTTSQQLRQLIDERIANLELVGRLVREGELLRFIPEQMGSAVAERG